MNVNDPWLKKVASFRLKAEVISILKAEAEKQNKGKWYNKVSQADLIEAAVKEKYGTAKKPAAKKKAK